MTSENSKQHFSAAQTKFYRHQLACYQASLFHLEGFLHVILYSCLHRYTRSSKEENEGHI